MTEVFRGNPATAHGLAPFTDVVMDVSHGVGASPGHEGALSFHVEVSSIT